MGLTGQSRAKYYTEDQYPSCDKHGIRLSEIEELAGMLDAVSDRQCVRAFKPDPQGFLTATQRLRALPWNCLGVVFDANGVEAVRRAGMLSVGIGPDSAGADLTVKDPASLDIERMTALLSAKEIEINPYLERNIAIVRSETKERGK